MKNFAALSENERALINQKIDELKTQACLNIQKKLNDYNLNQIRILTGDEVEKGTVWKIADDIIYSTFYQTADRTLAYCGSEENYELCQRYFNYIINHAMTGISVTVFDKI